MPRFVLLTCCLCLLPNLCLPVDLGATDPDWLRGSGDDLEIRVRGTLVSTGETAIESPLVTATLDGFLGTFDYVAKVDESNRFEVWLPVNRHSWYWLRLRAEDPATGHAANRKVREYELRGVAADELELQLGPPIRYITVTVVDEGQTVAGANVSARLDSGVTVAVTDKDGVAKLPAFDADQLRNLAAWTEDGRVGGFGTNRKPQRDPSADSFECELEPARDQLLRLIDESGNPVAGIAMEVKAATPAPEYRYIGDFKHQYVKTNDQGEVVLKWFPDWKEANCYVELYDPTLANVERVTWENGVATQVVKRLPPRKRIAGQLTGESVAGLCVDSESFQHPQKGRIDILSTFADAEGRFWIDCFANAKYVTYVSDSTWISDFDARILLPKDEPAESIELAVRKGTKAVAIVTAGDDPKPVTGASVSFRTEYRFEYLEDGKERNGILGRSVTIQADSNGQATASVPTGELTVQVYKNPWLLEKQVKVTEGETIVIPLHRPYSEGQTVTGQLVLADGLDADLTGAKVMTGAIDGQSDETMETTADADGKFEFVTSATHFGVYAETKDGRAAGVAISHDVDQTLRVKLFPTVTYRGRLLNKNGQPIANHTVTTQIRIAGEKRYDLPHLTSFEVRKINVRTDGQGDYTFEKLPTGLAMRIATFAPHDPEDWEPLEEIFLRPGEDRPLVVNRIDDGSPLEKTPAPILLSNRFAQILRDCRLGGYRMMVIRAGDSPDAKEFVDQNLLRYQHMKEIARYMPLKIDRPDALSDANSKFAKSHDWPSVESNQVFVAIIDADATELGREVLDIDDSDVVEISDALIRTHAPPTHDAKKKWQQAFDEAKRTGRRVWAVSGGRYCGPCIRLSRWIDDHDGVLDQDYVFFKVDSFLDSNGVDVAKRITRGGQHGVPFHAIFDTDGTVLADSEGPTGNIGMPSGYEGKRHLRGMLQETTQRVTEEQIAEIVQGLED